MRIDAAILSLQHSFIVDNYNCGARLGTLTVNGAIAQKYRGPVGTVSGTSPSHGLPQGLLVRRPPALPLARRTSSSPIAASWDVSAPTSRSRPR